MMGGLGSNILNNLEDKRILHGKNFRIIGIEDFPACGAPFEVLKYHKMDGDSLTNTIYKDITGLR